MIIRRVTEQDLPVIMEIERTSFIPAIQEREAVFEERIRICGNCFTIFEDEAVQKTAGYFSAERWSAVPDDDSIFSLNHSAESIYSPDGPVIYLSSFALLPQYRGRGTGSTFFSGSIKWFTEHNQGLSKAILLVNERWKGAVHIYTQFGFLETHRIRGFFPDGEGAYSDGIVMEKYL
jgi:[ribosomal protein S18]-alanine N-acetyltransferase